MTPYERPIEREFPKVLTEFITLSTTIIDDSGEERREIPVEVKAEITEHGDIIDWSFTEFDGCTKPSELRRAYEELDSDDKIQIEYELKEQLK